jgi:hypothetical protein
LSALSIVGNSVNDLESLTDIVKANGNKSSHARSQGSGQTAEIPDEDLPHNKQKTAEEPCGIWNMNEQQVSETTEEIVLARDLNASLEQTLGQESKRHSSRTVTSHRREQPSLPDPVESQTSETSLSDSTQKESQGTLANDFLDKTVKEGLMFFWEKRSSVGS